MVSIKMVSIKNIFINLIIFLSSLLVSLFILEMVVRILPKNYTKIDYSIKLDERIYTPTRYIKFKPNYTRVWTGLGPPTIWHYNNIGFRDRDIQINKPENIFRIVVIGDSIVMGFGVEDFEAFPRRLEQILKPKVFNPAMTHFEVMNLGIQGYSSPQYLAVLKEDALKMKPDLVIVAMYPSNDLSGAVAFKDDQLYTNLMSIPDLVPFTVNAFLKNDSKLYLFLLTKYYTFIKNYEVNSSPSEDTIEYGWRLIKEDLTMMQGLSKRHDVKFILLNLPRPREVEKSIFSIEQEKLAKMAEDLNVIHYDSLYDLKQYKNIPRLYLNDFDDHFSPEGNEYLALSLAKFLWDNNLVPKQPEASN